MFKTLKNIKQGIKNLIYYFSVIWKDRNWDNAYIEYLLLAKLERVYDHYTNKRSFIVEFEGMEDTLVKPLRICIFILKRREEGWYSTTWHDINYSESNSFFNKSLYEFNHPTKGLIAFNRCEQRDKKILFDILNKYLDYWWD